MGGGIVNLFPPQEDVIIWIPKDNDTRYMTLIPVKASDIATFVISVLVITAMVYPIFSKPTKKITNLDKP